MFEPNNPLTLEQQFQLRLLHVCLPHMERNVLEGQVRDLFHQAYASRNTIEQLSELVQSQEDCIAQLCEQLQAQREVTLALIEAVEITQL